MQAPPSPSRIFRRFTTPHPGHLWRTGHPRQCPQPRNKRAAAIPPHPNSTPLKSHHAAYPALQQQHRRAPGQVPHNNHRPGAPRQSRCCSIKKVLCSRTRKENLSFWFGHLDSCIAPLKGMLTRPVLYIQSCSGRSVRHSTELGAAGVAA